MFGRGRGRGRAQERPNWKLAWPIQSIAELTLFANLTSALEHQKKNEANKPNEKRKRRERLNRNKNGNEKREIFEQHFRYLNNRILGPSLRDISTGFISFDSDVLSVTISAFESVPRHFVVVVVATAAAAGVHCDFVISSFGK